MAIGKYTSKIKMPILRYDVEISYSEVEKPSGISYILLLMVQSAGNSSFSWQDLMNQFNLPIAMFGVFRDELELMRDKGMIDFSSVINSKTPVNAVAMTEIGKKAFHQGIITSQNQVRQDTALFLPGEGTRKYHILTPKKTKWIVDDTDDRFKQIQFDFEQINQYIEREKNLFSIRNSETIFNIRHVSQSYCSYYTLVGLSFNETLGSFTIIGSNKIDERFIKKYISIDELFDNLQSDPFSIPKELEFIEIHNTVDWEKYVYILPSELTLRNENNIITTLQTKIPGAYVVSSINDGTDFFTITSESIGYAYRIVMTPISITGMEKTVMKPLIVMRMISSDVINSLMFEVAKSQYDGGIIGLSKSLEILHHVADNDGAEKLIKDYLKSTLDVKGVYEITKIYKKSWNKMIRKWVLDLLSKMNSSDRLALSKSISSTKITIDGKQAGYLLKSSDVEDNIKITDALFRNISQSTIHDFIDQMEISDVIADYILKGKRINEPISDLFKNVNYASICLQGLKDNTGASELENYFYSYEAIKPENKQNIRKYLGDLSSRIKYLNQYIPSKGLDDLKDLAVIYSDISSTLDDNINFKSSNGRIFGINMRIWIEDMLSKLLDDSTSLDNMIEKSFKIYIDKDNRLITHQQRNVLHKIRHYGNSCAHDKIIFPVEEDDRQQWINVADEVERAIELYLSKKDSLS